MSSVNPVVHNDGGRNIGLVSGEELWTERFEFLKDRGYVLRPRYRPGWVQTWKEEDYLGEETAILPVKLHSLDARRIEDGTVVWLKCVEKGSQEELIGKYLQQPKLRDDPRNHAAPLLDTVTLPNEPNVIILVYPVLRRIDRPGMMSLGECVDYVAQTLEGLVFLHELEIAHRDCNWENIMMDGRALYPQMWHPQRDHLTYEGTYLPHRFVSRTAVGGVRYYFVDFGISTHREKQVLGLDGQVRAPELSETIPYDPYKLDVYILGKGYDSFLIRRHRGTEFFSPLIKYMTSENPNERPSAAEALEHFYAMRAQLTDSDLTGRLPPRWAESAVAKVFRDLYYRWQVRWSQRRVQGPPPPFL